MMPWIALKKFLFPERHPPKTREQWEQEAEQRWTKSNKERKKAGCFVCGAPATQTQEDHSVVGKVPYQRFTCNQHYSATSAGTDEEGNRYPTFKRWDQCASCENRCAQGGKIGGPTEHWYCPTRPDLEENQ